MSRWGLLEIRHKGLSMFIMAWPPKAILRLFSRPIEEHQVAKETHDGSTALVVASQNGHLAIVQVLIAVAWWVWGQGRGSFCLQEMVCGNGSFDDVLFDGCASFPYQKLMCKSLKASTVRKPFVRKGLLCAIGFCL